MAPRKSETGADRPSGDAPETAAVPPHDSPAPTDSDLQPDAGLARPEPDPDPLPEAPKPEPEPEPVPAEAKPEEYKHEDWAEPAQPEPEPQPQTEPARPRDTAEATTGGRSFAARALIALLLLIAGAALGIWGAPKLAPMLPAGVAPVADWLSPAADETAERIAGLEARVETALAAAESRIGALPGTDEIDTRIAAAVTEAEARSAAEVAALRETITAEINAEIAGRDDTSTRQALDRLAATLDGQAAELATLKDQLGGATAAAGTLTEDALARVDVYRAELEGLRAEVAALAGRTSGLAGRIDEVAATADRSIETAQAQVAAIEAEASTALDAAQVAADLALLRAALDTGQPFTDAADRLAAAAPDAPLPAGVAAAAATGAPTLTALRDGFPEAAHAAIRASIMASAGDGIVARTGAFLNAQIASRSLTPQPGMDPDAVLSRMEDRLRGGDLAGALAESDSLPSEARAAMAPWLAGARARLDAEAGLSELSTRLGVAN